LGVVPNSPDIVDALKYKIMLLIINKDKDKNFNIYNYAFNSLNILGFLK
jgi:hypothetical protein